MTSVASNFESTRDVQEKLLQGVVGYKGEWWLPYEIDQYWRMTCQSIVPIHIGKGPSHETINLKQVDEKEFNYKLYNLGFMELDNFLWYVSRLPVRKSRFCISGHNLQFDPVGNAFGRATRNRTESQAMFDASIRNGTLRSTLKGEYVSFDAARDVVQKETKAVAFDRNFALQRVSLRAAALFYQTSPVGELNMNSGEIELYPAYDYLFERLSEMKLGKIVK